MCASLINEAKAAQIIQSRNGPNQSWRFEFFTCACLLESKYKYGMVRVYGTFDPNQSWRFEFLVCEREKE